MGQYVNDARNERTEHEGGKTVGEQGGKGSGKVKCSSQGGSSSSPSFKPASEVVGAPIAGELDVPSTGLMKGSSSVQFEGAKKGEERPMRGGSLRKPKDAEDAGR